MVHICLCRVSSSKQDNGVDESRSHAFQQEHHWVPSQLPGAPKQPNSDRAAVANDLCLSCRAVIGAIYTLCRGSPFGIPALGQTQAAS